MAMKDYYLILGIPRNESSAGIRTAYRDLVKQYHPDTGGESDARRFRELAEAYEVLSDPDRRRHYNHDLRKAEQPAAPSVLQRTDSEPLVPLHPSIFAETDRLRPSYEEFLERYRRNFTGVGVPKSEHEEGLNIEVVLTPEEALRGGLLPVTLPVFETCPACHGSGEDWLFPCLECGTQGLVERRETVRVRIPPGARPGTVIELPLRGLGIHNFYLRVHVMVGEH